MGIDAVHTKYSTWDGAAKLRKFAEKFKPAKAPCALNILSSRIIKPIGGAVLREWILMKE